MIATRMLTLRNASAVCIDTVPVLPLDVLHEAVLGGVKNGARVAALFAHAPASGELELYVVLATNAHGTLQVARAQLRGDAYPALTPQCTQVHLFERELAENWGLRPEGHPWLKPVRFTKSRREGHDAWERSDGAQITVGVADFYRVRGAEVHEVAVGPVHAGIIEPGHFRFQCHGEQVFALEISLGYQHRGVERALVGGPNPRTIHYMETLAGDTTVGHTTAYCQAVEALSGASISARAAALRVVGLELERLANHTGALGALAGDIGFLPTAAFCGRLRGDFLNLTASLCGNRFGRGLVRPGGVRFDLEPQQINELLQRIEAARRDVEQAVDLLWNTPSVQARFEQTGVLSQELARELGLVGVVARACGIEQDVRRDFPTGLYRFAQLPTAVSQTGDVFARAYVRWLEIERSVELVRDVLGSLPAGAICIPAPAVRAEQLCVSLVEGFRGEICHVALSDAGGRLATYKVVDPSFHNWAGLAMALRNQQISDFPLCNKSFDLSYCGHDL
ncbi:MAG TPA: hypothetical protein VF331_25925 [Polyangiales bacterium]